MGRGGGISRVLSSGTPRQNGGGRGRIFGYYFGVWVDVSGTFFNFSKNEGDVSGTFEGSRENPALGPFLQ